MTQCFIRRSLITALIVSAVTAGLGSGGAAVPSAPIEPEAVGSATGAISVDEASSTATNDAPRGNPLWAIPLKNLSATRERPIFSPLRRPRAAAVATSPYVSPRPAKTAVPTRPQLALVGTIAGDKEGFGIFLDRATSAMLRLKTGQEHKGWMLREIRSREALFEKGEETVTLALPVRSVDAPMPQGEDKRNLTRSKR